MSQHEACLIGQVLAGRKDLFGDLLEPHLAALHRLVRAKMRYDSEADDVIQTTVMKAFTHLEQFRFEASFRAWLMGIATNEVLQWRQGRVPARWLVLDPHALAQLQVADPAASPFNEYRRRETARLFHRALAQLPEKYQAVIRLRDLEDCSISETAWLLRLSVAAVKTRHRRARLGIARLFAGARGQAAPAAFAAFRARGRLMPSRRIL